MRHINSFLSLANERFSEDSLSDKLVHKYEGLTSKDLLLGSYKLDLEHTCEQETDGQCSGHSSENMKGWTIQGQYAFLRLAQFTELARTFARQLLSLSLPNCFALLSFLPRDYQAVS